MATSSSSGQGTASSATTIFHLDERNRRAEEIITRYAKRHAVMDVGIGLVSLIPGAAIPALIAAIAAQAPVVYQPMAKELAGVYCCELDGNSRTMLIEGMVLTGAAGIAIEFARDFLMEIAGDLIAEAGVGTAASLIPGIGALIAAGIDAAVAATLTWRVGVMVSMYFQNGQQWLTDRHTTYKRSRELVKGFTPNPTGRANLTGIRHDNPEVREWQLAMVRRLVKTLALFTPGLADLRHALTLRGIPVDLIEQALQHLAPGTFATSASRT